MTLVSPLPRSTGPRRRATDGERDTFTQIYEQYRQPLYSLCLAKTKDPASAEDIVQDVFAKAFARRARFDWGRPPWPWLVAVASRQCIDAYRRTSYVRTRTDDLCQVASGEAASGDRADTTLATVLRRMEEQRLGRQLAALPDRQRVALQLFALDGWSYADIADQLGASIAGVKQLIVRARTKLREAGTGSLAALLGARRACRSRWVEIGARWQSGMSWWAEAVGRWTHVVAEGSSAVVVVALVLHALAAPSPADAGLTSLTQGALPTVTGVTENVAAHESPGTVRGPSAAPPAPAHVGGGRPWGPVEQTANEMLAPVVTADDAGPAEASSSTMTVSPGYEDDHTVFVAGRGGSYGSWPLFVTRDGGASWTRLRALGFGGGTRLLLPPAFPRDPRIFALGAKGLQVSHDGGESFETLVPGSLGLGGVTAFVDAAISPAFDRGEPTILLVGGGRLFEYDTERHTLQAFEPSTEAENTRVHSVHFGPQYPSDPTIFLSGGLAWPSYGLVVHRCKRERAADSHGAESESAVLGKLSVGKLACEGAGTVNLGGSTMRVTPRPGGGLFALLPGSVHVSFDEGHTFERVKLMTNSAMLNDLVPLPGHPHGALIAQARQGGPAVIRTDDDGRTWTDIHVGVPGFEWGARMIVVTPTGRLLAAGFLSGIACSADGGGTWGPTCPTPDTA